MPILTRGLRQTKVTYLLRANLNNNLAQQQIRKISACLRPEEVQLGLLNHGYNQIRSLSWNTLSFPPSPPSNIKPEEPDTSHLSFLEEPGEEYGYETKTVTKDSAVSSKFITQPPSQVVVSESALSETQVLLRLLSRNDVDTALAVKEEYDRLGIHLTEDRAFANYALAELDVRKNLDAHESSARTRRFLAWLSLVPLSSCQFEVMQIAAKLMENCRFEIPMMMGFCLLFANSRDLLFFRSVILHSRILPHIIRYGDPKATTAFLVKVESRLGEMEGADETRKELLRLFAKIHFLAGREELSLFFSNAHSPNLAHDVKSSNPVYLPVQTGKQRTNSDLAAELRAIRQCLVVGSSSPQFPMFVSHFIRAYNNLERRSRAIYILRKRFLTKAPLGLRASWVAGEQQYFSSYSKPLAGLRLFYQYCVSDPILEAEAQRVLETHQKLSKYKYRHLDHVSASVSRKVDIKWKSWPSPLGVHLAWKSILQLSKKADLERLYQLVLRQAHTAYAEPASIPEALQEAVHHTLNSSPTSEPQTNSESSIDDYFKQASSDASRIPPVPHNARLFFYRNLFHHFTVAFATRISPGRGLEVIDDMKKLGVIPTLDTWCACAGAVARSGDVQGAVEILKYIETSIKAEKAKTSQDTKAEVESTATSQDNATRDNATRGRTTHLHKDKEAKYRKTLQKAYNSVLRGFLNVGLFSQAHEIRRRMSDQKLVNKTTMVIMRQVTKYEKNWTNTIGEAGSETKTKYRYVDVSGHRLRAHRERTPWKDIPVEQT